MDRWQNCVAVVTGASSGIGAAIVIDLVKAGLRVVGLARRKERMEELKSQISAEQQLRLYAVKCDVTSEASVTEAFDWIIEKLRGVDILVNNAGILRPGALCTMDVSSVREIIDTNIMGTVLCTQRAFKSMKERNFAGHVVIINSITGHRIPTFPVFVEYNIYPPSKHALTAITEIYRQEFKGLGTKIKITSLSPGLVRTEIISEEILEMRKHCTLNPEDISNGVLYAISTPPHVQVHELIIKPIGENF